MTEKSFFQDLATFGSLAPETPANMSTGTPLNEVSLPSQQAPASPTAQSLATKKEEAARNVRLAKEIAAKGSPADLRKIVSAYEQGNQLGEAEFVKDLMELPDPVFFQKYGTEALRNRSRLADAYIHMRTEKAENRRPDQLLQDGAANLLSGAVGSVGAGATALGVVADYTIGRSGPLGPVWDNTVDRAFQAAGVEEATQPMAPTVAAVSDAITTAIKGKQTALADRQDAQKALEDQLDFEDSARQYEVDVEGNKDAPTKWDRTVVPKLRQMGRDTRSAIENYGDNTGALFNVSGQAVGSFMGISTVTRQMARAVVKNQLKKEVGEEAAKDILKSPEGKKLIAEQATKMAPTTIGAIEGGSSSQQAMTEIMQMSEFALRELPEYARLRDEGGMSHPEAAARIAADAGTVALLTAAPAAMVAGKLTDKIVGDPLGRFSRGKGLVSRTKDTAAAAAKETTEEASQGAISQLGANVGVASTGIDRDLTEGVGAAIGEGIVAGPVSVGATRAPGLAAEAVKGTAKTAAKGVSYVANKREKDAQAESDTGNAARERAQERSKELLEKLRNRERPVVKDRTGSQEEDADGVEEDTAPEAPVEEPKEDVAEILNRGLNLSEEEYNELAGAGEQVKEALDNMRDGDGNISRARVSYWATNQSAEQKEPLFKKNWAMAAIKQAEIIRNTLGSQVEEAVNALAEDDVARDIFAEAKDDLDILRQNVNTEAAEAAVRSITEEEAAQFELTDKEIAIIARLNKEALGKDTLKAAEKRATLNQAGGDLSAADVAAIQSAIQFKDAEEVRQKSYDDIADDYDVAADQYDAVIEGQGGKKLKRPNFRQVSDQIRHTGNEDNHLPAVDEHYMRAHKAAAEGDIDGLQSALNQMRGFVEALTEKVTAQNKSARNNTTDGKGRAFEYQNYNGTGEFADDTDTTVHLSNPNSLAFSMASFADAKFASDVFANMLDKYGDQVQAAYPDFDTNRVEAVEPAARIVKAFARSPQSTGSTGSSQDSSSSGSEPKGEAPSTPATNSADTTNEQRQRMTLTGGLVKNLLLGAKALNPLSKFFQRRKGGSNFITFENPIQMLLDNINNLEKLESSVLQRELTDAEKSVVNHVLKTMAPTIIKTLDARMNKLMQQPYKKGETTTWGEILQREASAKHITKLQNRVFSFVEQREDGSFGIDPRFAQAAVLSVVQEAMLNRARGNRPLTDEDVEDRLGVEASLVSDTDLKILAKGSPHQNVAQNVTRTLHRLVGIDAKSDTEGGLAEGLLASLAVEAILAAENTELTGNKVKGPILSMIKHKINVDDPSGETDKDGKPVQKVINIEQLEFAPNFNKGWDAAVRIPDVFTSLFGSARARHIGEAPKKGKTTQHRNHLAKLTKTQTKVADERNNTAYTANVPLVNTIEKIGEDLTLKFFGYNHLSEDDRKAMHKNTLLTVDGRNQSLASGWRNTFGYIDEMREIAQREGKPLGSIPVFFEHVFIATGRLMQQGLGTPQSDKIMRMVLTPTHEVLDLSTWDKAPEAMNEDTKAFWIMFAQATGTKLHKQPDVNAIVEEGMKTAQDPDIVEFVEALKDVLALGPKSSADDARARLDKALKGEAKHVMDSVIGEGGVAFQALLDLARAQMAAQRGGEHLSKFDTHMYAEADGVTDGPVNAAVHNNTGVFTPTQLRQYAKGGFLFGHNNTSLNEYTTSQHSHDRNDNSQNDAYTDTIGQTVDSILAKIQDPTTSSEIRARKQRMMRLMGALLTQEVNEVQSNSEVLAGVMRRVRDLVKNPMTQSVYGAGNASIARGLVKDMLDRFYSEVSEANVMVQSGDIKRIEDAPFFQKFRRPDGSNALLEDLDFFLSMTMAEDKDGRKYFVNPKRLRGKATQLLRNPTQGVVEGFNRFALNKMMEDHYVADMAQAIDEVSGGIRKEMRFAQTVASLQAVFFQDKLDKLYDAAMRKKGYIQSNGKPTGQQLSRKELDEIVDKALSVAPFYQTEDQNLLVTKTEGQTNQNTVAVLARNGAGLGKDGAEGNKRRVNGTSQVAAEAGVKVSPYTVQAMGDGQMVLNIYVDGNTTVSRSLPVYDGINISAKNLTAASEHINGAVFKGWMEENIMEMLYSSFQNTYSEYRKHRLRKESEDKDFSELRAGDFEGTVAEMSVPAGRLLDEVVQRAKSEGLYPDGMPFDVFMDQIMEQLEDKALSVKARKYTMGVFPSYTDHMALKGNSHHNPGNPDLVPPSFSAMSLEEKAQAMNEVYTVEYSRLKEETKLTKERPAVDPTDGRVVGILEDLVGSGAALEAPAPLTAFTREDGSDNLPAKYSKDSKVIGLKKGVIPLLLTKMRVQGLLNKDSEKLIRSFFRTKEQMALLDEYTFYFGSSDALSLLAGSPVQHGKIDPNTKRAYIANGSAETILHELLHIATIETLYAAQAPDAPTHAKKALMRLVDLANEFMSIPNMGAYDQATAEAYAAAFAAIHGHLEAGNQPEALSELISWSLTNQGLKAALQRKKNTSRLAKVARATVNALKRLLGVQANQGDTLFDAVLFNAEVITKSRYTVDPAAIRTVNTLPELDQAFPDDTGRMEHLEGIFSARLAADLQGREGTERGEDLKDDQAEAILDANEVEEAASKAGFDMNVRRGALFREVYATIKAGVSLDGASLREAARVQKIFAQTVKVDDFLKGEKSPTQAQKKLAQAKYDFLTIQQGRKDVLPTFLAMALVDEQVRDILDGMQLPKRFQKADNPSTMDGWVETITTSLTNLLSEHAVGGTKDRNALRHLDRVAAVMAHAREERATYGLSKAWGGMASLDDWISGKLKKAGGKVSKKLSNKADRSSGKTKSVLEFGALVADIFDPDKAGQVGDAAISASNELGVWRPLKELLFDVVGETEGNSSILSQLNKARTKLDRTRSQLSSFVTAAAFEAFKEDPPKKVRRQMHTVLGKTGLLTLGRDAAMALLKDTSKLSGLVSQAEADLKKFGNPKYAQLYMKKAKELADFNMGRDLPKTSNLLTNAVLISQLAGELKVDNPLPDPDLVKTISRLVTYYSLQNLDKDDLEAVQELISKDEEGVSQIMNAVHYLTKKEREKLPKNAPPNTALHNGWAGYIPVLNHAGRETIVAPQAKHSELVHSGYVKVGKYYPAPGEYLEEPHAIYRTKVGGKPSFRQGVAHAIHSTFMGVDTRTGVNLGSRFGEVIMGKEAKSMQQRIGKVRSSNAPGNFMVPIYGAKLEVIGYQRVFSEEDTGPLHEETDLFEILGVWMGRIEEEGAARELNKELVDKAFDQHKKDVQAGRGKEYVNVATSDDPVVQAAWTALGWEIKEDIKKKFGKKNYFPVRDDLVNVSLGHHRASYTDSWTGTSRWSKESQKAFRDTMLMLFGRKAFPTLRLAEDVIQGTVSYAKTNMLVRYGVIWMANEISNTLHGLLWNIGLVEQAKYKREAFLEITQYNENEEERMKLSLALASAPLGSKEAKRIETRIAALNQANEALNIWPLIEAGEFNTVAEDLSQTDMALTKGQFGDHLETLSDRYLPNGVREVGRQVAMAKDTALFKALNRGVQYSDFLSKYALYRKLQDVGGRSEGEIMRIIRNEYVNYNLPAGRTRDALEANGLAWFLNYKLRILKVMASAMRYRPASALLMMAGVGPAMGIDTVASGSLAGSIAKGSTGYLFGWEMGLNSLVANPLLAR